MQAVAMRDQVVKLLRDMAEAMREAGDRGRASAYARAADAIEKRADFDDLAARGRLRVIPGIGPSIEEKIIAFLKEGVRPEELDEEDSDARPGIADAYYAAPFSGAPDIHVHTTWSDGMLSIEEVVLWAKELRAPAVGISDHSGSLGVANGLKPDRVREQWNEIEAVQAKHPEIRILRGTECDIKRDGTLDHPNDLLAEFDYVIGSLHSQLTLDRRSQTDRVLRALENEHLTILGHPTTRRLPRRPQPAALDLDAIFAKAAERGVAMEVNGSPGRMDLDIPHAKQALAAGCKLSCGSDGHSAREMLSFATARLMAQQAGAKETDLVNFDVLEAPRGR